MVFFKFLVSRDPLANCVWQGGEGCPGGGREIPSSGSEVNFSGRDNQAEAPSSIKARVLGGRHGLLREMKDVR